MRPDPVLYPGFAKWCDEFGLDPETPYLVWIWLDHPAAAEDEDESPDAMVVTF